MVMGLSLVCSEPSCEVDRFKNYFTTSRALTMLPMSETSEVRVNTDERKRRGRRPTKRQMFGCQECGYQSDRFYNVERHAKRIHSKSIYKDCCNLTFLTKSDYYNHIEDYHPNMRPTCYVSRAKYQIFGHKMKLSTNFRYDINDGNTQSNENNDEDKITRRSKRIQERLKKGDNATLRDISSDNESECSEYNSDNMEIDFYVESSNDSDDYQPMNNLNTVSWTGNRENSGYEESEHSDNSNNSNCYKRKIQSSRSSPSFREYQLTLNDSRYKNVELKMIENVPNNTNTEIQLPLKKRILCEINNNIEMNVVRKNNEVKIKKKPYDDDDKENHYPIDITLNKYQGTTIVQKIPSSEQSGQLWYYITQHQREYLKYIDFDSF